MEEDFKTMTKSGVDIEIATYVLVHSLLFVGLTFELAVTDNLKVSWKKQDR